MDVGSLLLRLLAVLVAARVAAEIAERLRQPAVLAEILVGIVLGPSVFHIVGGQEQLQFLGELGAILLLFDVGLHMDLDELRHVGRASLQVATVGRPHPRYRCGVARARSPDAHAAIIPRYDAVNPRTYRRTRA
ncbi:MAG: cation:proton antiporter [Actinomycetota bacterium]